MNHFNRQAAPVFPRDARIFCWLLHQLPRFQADTRLNGHGSLMDQECRIICSTVVHHIAAHLRSFAFGYGISERYLTALQRAQIDGRKDAHRYIDEAKLRRDRITQGQELHELSKIIAANLLRDAPRMLSLPHGFAALDSVVARAPAAAAYYLGRIMTAWDGLTPAQKFLIIGGETGLQILHGGGIPNKALKLAIYHLCLRGTSTSGDENVFERASGAVVTDDQVRTARLFVAKIPDSLELLWQPKSNDRLPPFSGGLQRVLSRRGRVPGSREGGFKRRRKNPASTGQAS